MSIRIACAAGLFALAACSAPDESQVLADLRQATATAMPDAPVDQIEISHQQRGAAKWQWQARFNGKSFACDADDKMRLPSCTQLAG
jgi:hypothetical protein